MIFNGLAGRVAFWLLCIFSLVVGLGWHQWQDISIMYNKAVSLEQSNRQSHHLHEIELHTLYLSVLVHDYLLNGDAEIPQHYRLYSIQLRRGIDNDVLRNSLTELDNIAEKIFSLPFATGNMEGPMLLQDMDNTTAKMAQGLSATHHRMDNEVNRSILIINSMQLDMRDDLIFSLVLIFLLLIGLTYYLYMYIIRPLLVMRYEVMQTSQTHRLPQCPDLGNTELGELARAINRMGVDLQQHQMELDQAKSLLAHQEKMQAMGLMTASIAHEVGNPLAAAAISLDLAKRKISNKTCDAANKHVGIAIAELQRIETIINNILEFGRTSSSIKEQMDINAIICSAMQLVKLAKAATAKNIRYQATDIAITIHGNEDILRQVLVNLLLNAVDASSATDGKVFIQVQKNKAMLFLDVSDHGCGIADEHIDMIFSPMFSTKDKKGNGLGLAISRDLIQQMGGRLELTNNYQQGCTFRITLPIA